MCYKMRMRWYGLAGGHSGELIQNGGKNTMKGIVMGVYNVLKLLSMAIPLHLMVLSSVGMAKTTSSNSSSIWDAW